MKIISENIAKNIATTLRESDGILWLSCNYEIQDDGQFLLIQIDVDEKYNLQKIESTIISSVGDKIPLKENDYYWMAVLLNTDRKVIESIMPKMLLAKKL